MQSFVTVVLYLVFYPGLRRMITIMGSTLLQCSPVLRATVSSIHNDSVLTIGTASVQRDIDVSYQNKNIPTVWSSLYLDTRRCYRTSRFAANELNLFLRPARAGPPYFNNKPRICTADLV
jgi:hypothetical protein